MTTEMTTNAKRRDIRTEIAPEGTRDLLRYAQRVIALYGVDQHAMYCTDRGYCARCVAINDYELAKVRMQLWHEKG